MMVYSYSYSYILVAAAIVVAISLQSVQSFTTPPSTTSQLLHITQNHNIISPQRRISSPLYSSPADTKPPTTDDTLEGYEPPEDAIIQIKSKAMSRLIELKSKRDTDPKSEVEDPTTAPLILRMGVRNGGCSGLSYVMDFSTSDDIQEDDEVDIYEAENIQCVVDAKSLLYLYGLELDYSDELIGGGFKFFNPNAEENCGCGSSFGV